MKALALYLLICLCSSTLCAQHLEFFGGLNRNHLFAFKEIDRQFTSNDKTGYSFGLSLENLAIEDMPVRVVLKFDEYKDSIYLYDGGLGGGNTLDGTIDKHTIALGLYPFNWKVTKQLQLNFGGELSALLYEKAKGYKSYWQSGVPGYNHNLADGTENISNKFNFGIISRVAYYIPIKGNCYLVPQYQFYLGLSKEFRDFQQKIKAMRHYVALGIVTDLKKNDQKQL